MAKTGSKIGIMGSAFNPPTRGHEDLLKQAIESFDKVFLIPNYCHAFGKEMLDYPTRCLLVQEFLDDIQLPNCKILMVEHLLSKIYSSPNHINQEQPVYTYNLLDFLSKQYPNDQLHFILGPDNAKKENWQKFHRYQEIEQRWGLFMGQENMPVRSTLIRDKIHQNLPFSDLTTPSVYHWIQALQLYTRNQ